MDVSETCSICQKQSNQMLMLSCVHDPCLTCAAHNHLPSSPVYTCPICHQRTPLDPSTLAELHSHRMPTSITTRANVHIDTRANVHIDTRANVHIDTRANVNTKSNGNNTKSNVKNNNTYSNSRKKTTHMSPSPTKNNRRSTPTNNAMTAASSYMCSSHREEELTYYCFTCQETICPECAIHGPHHSHPDIKLIKLIIPQVKHSFLTLLDSISTAQSAMNNTKDLFLIQLKQTADAYTNHKLYVRRQFEELQNMVTLKEQEMLKQLEAVNRQNVASIKTWLEQVNG